MFADWDNDGYPDHVMGPDGLWRSFDPHTGDMVDSRQAPQAPPRAPRSSTCALSLDAGAHGSTTHGGAASFRARDQAA
jgi:hypothetical protein